MTVETVTEAEARRLISATRLPLALVFSATSPPCRAPAFRLDSIAAEFSGRIEVRRLEMDEDTDLAHRFGFTWLPTMALFAHGGKAPASMA